MSTTKVRKIKPYSGYTQKTADRLQLDAGAFFKNFEVGTDTYTSAKAAGKCLGVTIKGGEFSAKPNLRQIEFDGVKNRTKGQTLIDGWETYIKGTFAEITTEALERALGVADHTSKDGYDKITGRDVILDSDYIGNITWVGCLLGEEKPIIIQVYNALNEDGLTLAVADKDNGKTEVTFYGYNDESVYDSDEPLVPPFAIYRPTETDALSLTQSKATTKVVNKTEV